MNRYRIWGPRFFTGMEIGAASPKKPASDRHPWRPACNPSRMTRDPTLVAYKSTLPSLWRPVQQASSYRLLLTSLALTTVPGKRMLDHRTNSSQGPTPLDNGKIRSSMVFRQDPRQRCFDISKTIGDYSPNRWHLWDKPGILRSLRPIHEQYEDPRSGRRPASPERGSLILYPRKFNVRH
jgi:hypothetical protein